MSPITFLPGASAVKSRHTTVGDRRGVGVGFGEAYPPRPRLAGHQAEVAHQGAHQLDAARLTPAGQLGVHAAVPVGLVGVSKTSLMSSFSH